MTSVLRTGLETLLVLCLTLLSTSPAQGQEQEPEYPAGTLSLHTIVKMVLERDPNIAVAKETVKQNEGSFQQASGKFDNVFSLSQGASRTFSTYVSTDPNSPDTYSTDITQSFLSSSWLLRTGQTLTPQIGITRTTYSDNIGMGVQNAGVVMFGITQPLLRGRRPSAVTAAERSAELTLQSSVWTMKHTISERIKNAAIAFFNFVAAREDLKTKFKDEANAKTVLEAMKKLAERGEQPQAEVLPLEADYFEKVTSRLQTELDLAKARSDLGIAIGIPQDEIRRLPLPADVLPKIDLLSIPGLDDTERYVKEALSCRLDLKARKATQQASEALLVGRRDAMRRRADIQLGAGYQGFTTGWGFGNYFAPLKPSDVPFTFSASLSMELPTNNAAAWGAFVAQDAIVSQNQILAASLAILIGDNVASYMADLRRYALQHDSASRSLDSYQIALANEQKKLKAGVATVTSLIQMRNYHVAAAFRELSIRLNIIRTIVNLRFETGTILSDRGEMDSVDIEHLISIPLAKEAGK